MTISQKVVEHVSRLAYIGLAPDEIEQLVHDLTSVLDHIQLLNEVGTENVVPTSYAVATESVMRDDEVTRSWPIEAVLANAPRQCADMFEVQPVLD